MMRGVMRKLIFVIAGFFFAVVSTKANDIYIAQNATGAANGADCADANAVSFFNTSGNWGKSASQIGPGTTVHLCGTFTASAGASGYLTFQGSGTSGSPVTLRFEGGAIVQAPYWGANGAIYISGSSYITIDGGTNGLIQATLNGTSGGTCPGGPCTNQQYNGAGVYITGAASNIEVKNLTIANLYNHTSVADTGVDSMHHPFGVAIWGGGAAIKLNHNVIHDVDWGVMIQFYNSPTGPFDFNNNNIYNISCGICGGDGNPGSTLTGPVNIYNNNIHDFDAWDANGDVNHHDGVYLWMSSASSSFTGTYNIYNNSIYNLGIYCTAPIYFEEASNTFPVPYVFNNVLGPLNQCVGGNTDIYDKTGKMRLYNNTMYGSSTGAMLSIAGNSTEIIENNIVTYSGASYAMDFSTASIQTSDYNDWVANPQMHYSGFTGAFTSYKSTTGLDAHSITTAPNLNASYVPNAGSPVIGTGLNLYSTCNGQPNPGLGALCYDKAGVARPTTAAWDMGALQSGSSSSNAPNPPSGLSATVN
jgi:hypothetical protein